MALHYLEKQRAQVNVGDALAARGWKLWSYTEDRSDIMTDYFAPAHWDGIATHEQHPDIVVCVWVSESTAQQSGKEERRLRSVPGETCLSCGGTGIEPGALTYNEAVANPEGQHANCQRGGILLLPGVVSPAHYRDDGQPRCATCHGRGHMLKSEEYVAWTWPQFSATPRGRFWHVEHRGRVVASGTGMSQCYRFELKPQPAVLAVADAIEAAVLRAEQGESKPEPKTTAPGNEGSAYTISYERDWTWLSFPAKPSDEVLESVRSLGGRWSRKRRAWYFTRRVEPQQIAQTL